VLRLPCLLLAMLVPMGCHSQPEEREVEVEVDKVGIDPASHSPVVVLREKGGGAELPIWIGPTEARAIAMHLEQIEPPRPFTHDLAKQMLERSGIGLERVLIHTLEQGTYHARIFLTANGEDVEIDSRPSDAIALALRFESPIFVVPSLLDNLAVAAVRWGDAETLIVQGVTVQTLSSELADHFVLPAGQGVLVSGVAPDAVSRLRPGDIILEVDGGGVRGLAEFARMVQGTSGRPNLTVQRAGSRVQVRLEPLRR